MITQLEALGKKINETINPTVAAFLDEYGKVAALIGNITAMGEGLGNVVLTVKEILGYINTLTDNPGIRKLMYEDFSSMNNLMRSAGFKSTGDIKKWTDLLGNNFAAINAAGSEQAFKNALTWADGKINLAGGGPGPGQGGGTGTGVPLPAGSFRVSQGWNANHNAIDLAAKAGTPIRSVSGGKHTGRLAVLEEMLSLYKIVRITGDTITLT